MFSLGYRRATDDSEVTRQRSSGLGAGRRARRRRLLLEGLEDRRLLAFGPGVAIPGMENAAGGLGKGPVEVRPMPPPARVDELVSEATRRAMQLVGHPQGMPHPRAAEMRLVATGPSPGELRIRTPHNLNAADTTNVEQVQPGGSLGLNLTGAGYTVGIWDGGTVRASHQEFGGRVTAVDSSGSQHHPTHVAGTIGASGVYNSAKGMATQVSIRSRDWTSDKVELAADAPLIDVSNHSYGNVAGWSVYPASSWGVTTSTGNVDVWFEDRSLFSAEDTSFGKYSSAARELDQVLFDNSNLLTVWSAGNDRNDAFSNASGDNNYITYFSSNPGNIGWSTPGWYLAPDSGATTAPGGDGNGGTGYDSLSSDQNAKNSLVVGAVNDVTVDPYSAGDVVMTRFSSYGPTDDGRIKPDVVGNGASLTSSTNSSDTTYGGMSGTSMSSPNVAGTAVLMVEHFENSFGFAPRSASTKGALIHTASDAGNAGPDYAYGWGLVDAAAAASFITDAATGVTQRSHFIEQTYSGSAWSIDVDSNGSEPLKATIAWTDPAGTVHGNGLDLSTAVLVHDLDLWLAGPGGTIHHPWTLSASNPSAAAIRTEANHIDNVEQVLVDAPVAGTYTLHVGHSGTSFLQDYSLLLSGAATGPDTAAPTVVTQHPIAGATIMTEDVGIDITFSEPVQGVDSSDLVLSGAAAASAAVGAPTLVSGNLWRFPVQGLVDGALNLSLAPDAGDIEDLAGNDLAPTSWTNTVALAIANPSQISFKDTAAASIYPSAINVAGLSGTITDVNVTLHGLSHTWPADIDLLLVGPAGQKVVLMSDVGGNTDANDLTLQLDDEATNALPDTAALTSGAFKPTNIGTDDVFPAPAPGGPYASALTAFDGTDPNGTWSLYAYDDVGGDTGAIAGGWSLAITTGGGDPNTAEIRGAKWEDRNGDGAKDAAEPLLAGWTIYLDSNNNGQFDTSEPSTVTAADGTYSFNGLPAGTYSVGEVLQTGWEQTFPGMAPSVNGTLATAAAPEDDLVDFAFRRAADLSGYESELLDQAAQWVVRFADDALQGIQSARQRAASAGAQVISQLPWLSDTFLWEFAGARVGMAAAEALSTVPGLLEFYPLVARQQKPRSAPNDPLFADQWHLANTGQTGGSVGADANVLPAWSSVLGSGVLIAVVDDGLQHAHPDLSAQYVANASWDFNGDDADPAPNISTDFHGTAAAGVVAGRGSNTIGVAGAAPAASLSGLKLIAGPSTDQMEAVALTFMAQENDIYSNSWGPADDAARKEAPGPLLLAALQDGIRNGRGGLGNIYVWAAGNGLGASDNANYDGYASSRYTIAVSAIDHNGVQASYSEPGAPILVAGYSSGSGVGVTTTDLVGPDGYSETDYTNSFGGTSSATPLISGVVALMLEANPNLSWRDVQHILVNSVRQNHPSDADWLSNGAGRLVNHKYGFGAIDAEAAVALASGWATVAPEVSDSSGPINVAQAIPDNNATGVTSSFTTTSAIRVESVEVVLDATHTWRGDLQVVLTSPSGTKSVLAERHGDSGDNYNKWVFNSVRHWGELSAGDWKLQVVDTASGDTGTWNDWQLNVYGTPATVPGMHLVSLAAGQIATGVDFGNRQTVPQVVTLSPADDSTGVAQAADLMVTFDKDMAKGTGDILIKKSSDDSLVGTIDVTSAAVTVSGTGVMINPAGDLLEQTGYYVQIPATAFVDLAGNAYAGIADTTTWNFTTGDFTAPTREAVVAADVGEAAVGQAAYSFTITFADNVAIDVSTLDGNDVSVSGPGGFVQNAGFVSVDMATDGAVRTASYSITPPGGDWDAADDGTYTIALNAGQVLDTAGNAVVGDSAAATFSVGVGPAPAVAAVFVNNPLNAESGGWSDDFRDFVDGGFADPSARGYQVPNQVDTLPWINIAEIKLQFSEDVELTESHVAITVTPGGNPDLNLAPVASVTAFSYDPMTFIATLSLDGDPGTAGIQPVMPAVIDLQVSASVADRAGNLLQGGTFPFRLSILPGDANPPQNMAVLGSDVIYVRNHQNQYIFRDFGASAGYDPRADVTGDGVILGSDIIAARDRQNSYLTPPPVPSGTSSVSSAEEDTATRLESAEEPKTLTVAEGTSDAALSALFADEAIHSLRATTDDRIGRTERETTDRYSAAVDAMFSDAAEFRTGLAR